MLNKPHTNEVYINENAVSIKMDITQEDLDKINIFIPANDSWIK